MQQSCYKKEGFLQYLVVSCSDIWKENYQNTLLQCAEIPHLLPYDISEINGEQNIYYRLSYKTTLKSVEGHLAFTKDRLEHIVESIVNVLISTEDYLLETEHIVWNSSFIYIDAETGYLQFCYFPDTDVAKEKITDLLTEIMQFVDKKKEEEIIYLLQFYNLITEPELSYEKLKQYTNSIEGERDNYRAEKEKKVNEISYASNGKTNYKTNFEVNLEMNSGVNSEVNSQINAQIKHKIKKIKELHEYKSHNQKEIKKVVTSKEEPIKSWPSKIIGILLIGTAIVDILLILCLVLEILTYDYIKYLLFGMGSLIVLTILYMQGTKEESADDIMQEYFDNTKSAVDKPQGLPAKDITHISTNSQTKTANDFKSNMESKNVAKGFIGETTVLSQADEKYKELVVVEEVEKQLYLESMIKDKHEAIILKEESIVLGCMKDSCNYLLEERGISRMHAKLMRKMDGIYLLDLNSTNGTYLNGEIIESGKDYKLEEGDLVAFAQCEFYVAGKEMR